MLAELRSTFPAEGGAAEPCEPEPRCFMRHPALHCLSLSSLL